MMKLTKHKFVALIGGWKKFRDFLGNHMQYYIPPEADFTAQYGLDLLQKRKKAFSHKEVNRVKGVPKEAEFKVKNLLDMVKDDKEVEVYLPEYSKT